MLQEKSIQNNITLTTKTPNMKIQKQLPEKCLKKHHLTAGNAEQTTQDGTAQHLVKHATNATNETTSPNSACQNKEDRKYIT